MLSQQLNAVIVSCGGEKKASEFLSNSTCRSIDEFLWGAVLDIIAMCQIKC